MSWLTALRLALVAGWLVLAWPAAAAGESVDTSHTPVRLDGSSKVVDLDLGSAWLDRSGQLGIEQVSRGVGTLVRTDLGAHGAIPVGAALWLKLMLERTPSAPALWKLELPLPVLDKATVYLKDDKGRWRGASAGDLVESSTWPEPGRYPVFALELPHDAPLEVYARIQHSTPLSLPVRMIVASHHDQRARLEYLALGVAFGGLLLLVVGSLWQAWTMNDRSYTWFAGYCLVAMLAVASYTGVAAHLIWGDATTWSDAAPGCLSLLAASLALRITRQLTTHANSSRWLPEAMRVLAALGPVLASIYLILPRRSHGIALLGVYLMAVAVLSLIAATLTWRRHDPVGRWMISGALPLAASVLLALARIFGLVEGSWMTEYSVVVAIAWNLPMLKAALNSRLHERRSTQLRQQALSSHDPLTGLPKLAPFRARLRRALGRYATHGEPSALVVVCVANLPAIKVSRGAEVAEECLLRSVIKMQKLLRDVDSLGRVGDSCFGVVLEGADTRAAVSDFASHLVASGLILDPEHPGDPLLQFHVVAALLTEHPAPGVTLVEELVQLLSTMSPRTRRPVRYLHPQGDDGRPIDDIARVPNVRQLDRIPEVI